MGRLNKSPQKKRSRASIGEFLRDNPIKDSNGINDLVKELILIFLKMALMANWMKS